MLNTEDFIERLEYLIKHYELSASSFADKIGVQRSGISHLLSGRNKPSLDFVLKLGDEFPEVNLYWLLQGTGTFIAVSENEKVILTEQIIDEEKIPAPSLPLAQNRDIDKIVIFYRDGSFSDYKPRT
jgi:transcriptional regulator with XRE-family HTH domain